MLITAIASEDHISISNVGNSIKAEVEDGALFSGMGNTNDDVNGTNIDEVTATGSLKKGVDT